MGMATAFTTVTYAATKFRGKDDGLNYVLGGFAAGGMVGAWSKSFPTGCLAGILLGKIWRYLPRFDRFKRNLCSLSAGAAFAKHVGMDEGWGFMNNNWQQGSNTLSQEKTNYTVLADPGKNWSNGY